MVFASFVFFGLCFLFVYVFLFVVLVVGFVLCFGFFDMTRYAIMSFVSIFSARAPLVCKINYKTCVYLHRTDDCDLS